MNLTYRKLFGILFITWVNLMGLFSCKKEANPADFYVQDVPNGSCKGSLRQRLVIDNPESLVYKTVQKNYLSVKHENAIFNCC